MCYPQQYKRIQLEIVHDPQKTLQYGLEFWITSVCVCVRVCEHAYTNPRVHKMASSEERVFYWFWEISPNIWPRRWLVLTFPPTELKQRTSIKTILQTLLITISKLSIKKSTPFSRVRNSADDYGLRERYLSHLLFQKRSFSAWLARAEFNSVLEDFRWDEKKCLFGGAGRSCTYVRAGWY